VKAVTSNSWGQINQQLNAPYPVQLLEDVLLLGGALGGEGAEGQCIVFHKHHLILTAADALMVLLWRPPHRGSLGASLPAAGPAGEVGGGAPEPATSSTSGTISLSNHPRPDNPHQLRSVPLEVPFIVTLTVLPVTSLVTLRINLHQNLIILEVTLKRIIFLI
jgi:hypothetical protein